MRTSGIRLLETLPWGTHICVFYESKEDLLNVNLAYLGAGLESNEYCVWAVSEPATVENAREFLRETIPKFDQHVASGRIEILPAHRWYLEGDRIDARKITGGWDEKLALALSKGFEGVRISGNAFWLRESHWKEFTEYEQELDRAISGKKMVVMCTYPLQASRAVDLLDVVRAHQFTIAMRDGEWEFLETPELKSAKSEISRLNDGLRALSRQFPGHDLLTERERVVLAHIVRGASSKETALILNISARTVEFHRANIMQKLMVKNAAELVCLVLGSDPRSFDLSSL